MRNVKSVYPDNVATCASMHTRCVYVYVCVCVKNYAIYS